jgi:S1-C subfamily serine protease
MKGLARNATVFCRPACDNGKERGRSACRGALFPIRREASTLLRCDRERETLSKAAILRAWLVLAVLPLPPWLHAQPVDAQASVVKVRAVNRDGTRDFGSAVVIGKDLLATACHVIRDASRVVVLRGEVALAATPVLDNRHQDVCVVTVPGLDLPAVPLRGSAGLRIHERVFAMGFPAGGNLAIQSAEVEELYGYEGGKVIRTSARFGLGASGGALLDESGRLLGLLAFTRRYDGHGFAVPADWILALLVEEAPRDSSDLAFFEESEDRQPVFLR